MTDFHDQMMAVQGQITAALEQAGLDPCPAIKISQDVTKAAWDVWSEQQTEIQRLTDCLEAYKTAEAKVLRVEFREPACPQVPIPTLIITAPGMNEKKLAKYCIDIYRLYFACLTQVIKAGMWGFDSTMQYMKATGKAMKQAKLGAAREQQPDG